MTAFIRHDLIANLDHLMETPAGQKLKNSYPEAVWQTLLTDGRQYLLPGSMVLPPDLTANYWINRPLAEQYGIDTENWGEDIWNHRDELLEVWAGEHTAGNFELIVASEAVRPEQTPVLKGGENSLIFNEISGQFENYYDDPSVQAFAAFYRGLTADGYMSPEKQYTATRCFIAQSLPPGCSGDAAASDYEPIGEEVRSYFYNDFESNLAVSSWSRHPQDALELIRILYTDPDLNRVLIETDGRAERDPEGRCLIYWLGNPFLYDGCLETADAAFEVQTKSGLYGRTLDFSGLTDELNAVFDFRLLHSFGHKPGTELYQPAGWAAELNELGLAHIVDTLNSRLNRASDADSASAGE